MGISGLTTFMKNNPQLAKEFPLQSTKVVIDGNSLYHFIFYYNQVDSLHGGDYDHYALKIREFFSLLHTCNIQPYIVLDGGNEPDGMKFETIQNRMKHRLKLVNQLAKNEKDICKVMPILAFDTFRAVLQEIRIPLAVCDFEADKEIGLLANKLNCPVLSNDSDFYILPLTAGFIHFDCVDFTLQETKMENKSSEYFLPARLYHVDNFASFFPSLGTKVLPLLATLLGNDYVKTSIFKPFYSSIWKLNGKKQFRFLEFDHKILIVILWLQSVKTYDEAIFTIKSKAQNSNDRKTISNAFRIITERFTFNKTENESSLYSLLFGKQPDIVRKTIRGFNKSVIPEWYVREHRKGILPPRSMDIVTLHRTFLTPQVESSSSQASSYKCSEKLRAFMYGILLSEDIAVLELKEGLITDKECAVEEYDQKDDFNTSRFVHPLQTLTQHCTLPKLSEIKDLSTPDKENILRMILNTDSLRKYRMTKDLELVIGIILFWVKEAEPKVTLHHLQSVLVCMIMLKVKWVLLQGGDTGSEKNLIETAVLNMTGKSLEEVGANLLTYNTELKDSVNNPVKSELIHGFAQLQTCIMATMHFNSLLLHPFPSPCIPHIFSGTFLYNFFLELKEQKDPDFFIHELLVKGSQLTESYQCLFDAVMESIDPNRLEPATKYLNEKLFCKGRRPKLVENVLLTTSNKFSCLYMGDSEDDD